VTEVGYVGSIRNKPQAFKLPSVPMPVRLRTMSFTQFRIVAQNEPPNPESADEEARWGRLADTAIGLKDTSRNERELTTTRAHEDHERLQQELQDTLDRYDREYRRVG
jgi:hypothetical protein